MRPPKLVDYHVDLQLKLFGYLGFLNTGCFGKLGRAGLNTLKERQYSHAVDLTDDLAHAVDMIASCTQA